MRVIFHSDGPTLLRRAGAWLQEAEAENCYLLGTCGSPTSGASGPDRLFLTLEDGDALVGAAMWAPPGPRVVTQLQEAAGPALVEALRARGAALTHVSGPVEAVERFAALWEAASGSRAVVAMRQGLFQLTRVRPPRPAEGHLRSGGEGDLPLLADWAEAFAIDAGLPAAQHASIRRASAQWVKDRSVALWEANDKPVSMAVALGPTPRGIRVGFVYTPPAFRNRGFASACVAELSQQLLDAGRRFCFLFTDLANPTSNRIYQAIGYEWVGESRLVRFEPRTS